MTIQFSAFKAIAILSPVFLSIGGSGVAQEDQPDILQLSNAAAHVIGAKAIHQIHVTYSIESHTALFEDVWISLENGWFKRLWKKVTLNGENPLQSGIPSDSAPYTHGGWKTDVGMLILVAGTGDWFPSTAPSSGLTRELSQLSPAWVPLALLSGGKGTPCCGDEASGALIFPPIDSSKENDKLVEANPPFKREYKLRRGLVVESYSSTNEIVTDRVVNEFVEAIDLTPPPTAQRWLTTTTPQVKKASDYLRAPLPTELGKKPSFGFAAHLIPKLNWLMVSDVWDGSPAHRAGLKPNDRILNIDNVAIDALEKKASSLFDDKPKVRLTVQSRGDEPRIVEMEKVATQTFMFPSEKK